MFRRIGCKLCAGASKGTLLQTAGTVAASPLFAVVLLGGIVGWQIWKGKKDAGTPEATTPET